MVRGSGGRKGRRLRHSDPVCNCVERCALPHQSKPTKCAMDLTAVGHRSLGALAANTAHWHDPAQPRCDLLTACENGCDALLHRQASECEDIALGRHVRKYAGARWASRSAPVCALDLHGVPVSVAPAAARTQGPRERRASASRACWRPLGGSVSCTSHGLGRHSPSLMPVLARQTVHGKDPLEMPDHDHVQPRPAIRLL